MVDIGGRELVNSLARGPEMAPANLPPGRLGGKVTCLLPVVPPIGCPVAGAVIGGAVGGGCLCGVGDDGGSCGVPPDAAGVPGLAAAADLLWAREF